MSHEADALRGKQAQQVIENEIYAGAYTQVEEAITGLWKASRDPLEREELHKMLGLLGKVRGVFESAMRSGEVAEKELQRKRSLKERLTPR
jgi:hypothetical protein